VCVCVCVCVAPTPRSRSVCPWGAVAPPSSTLFCSGMARSLAVAHSLTTPLTLRSRSLGVYWLVAVAPMPFPLFLVLFSRLRVRLRQIAPYRMRLVLGGFRSRYSPPLSVLLGLRSQSLPQPYIILGFVLPYWTTKAP